MGVDCYEKLLTEVMGECYHTFKSFGANGRNNIFTCQKCNTTRYVEFGKEPQQDNNFKSWEGFGKLINWCKNQEWFVEFLMNHYDKDDFRKDVKVIPVDLCDPDKFKMAVYRFLKERKD